MLKRYQKVTNRRDQTYVNNYRSLILALLIFFKMQKNTMINE